MRRDVHRVFDVELVVVECREVRPSQPLDLSHRCGTQPIVLASGVAIAEDKNSRFAWECRIGAGDAHCFTLVAMTEPSASSSVTISGMSPSACVAQERQGS